MGHYFWLGVAVIPDGVKGPVGARGCQNKCSSRKDKYCGINVWASYTNVTCVILQITFPNGYNYKLQPQPYFTAHYCINASV
jgi:hypothetical protein